ncbi:MAG: mechanosensitive ion channel, partial [Acidobacteria bacterium]|nr:mechanosensitive ion channel [Acidobacteriota bacterium]
MVAWLLTKLVRTIVDRVEREVTEGSLAGAAERAKRIRTLGNLVVNTVGVVVFGAATLMVLKELNVDIMPLLTGAGILGLAIGFGAQTLVKDVISGFFLILENQVR